MSGRLITVCDICNKEQKMPTSWGKDDNPYRGWLQVRYHGDDMKDICPDCTVKYFSQQLIVFLQRFWKG